MTAYAVTRIAIQDREARRKLAMAAMRFVALVRMAPPIVMTLWSVSAASAADFNPNNFLVMSNPDIREYTPTGQLVQTIRVPWPDGTRPATELVRDSVVTEDGRLAIFNGTFTPWMTVFDPVAGTWDNRRHDDGWSTGGNHRFTGITSWGKSVVATDASTAWPGEPWGLVHFDLKSGQAVRFDTEVGTMDATLGLDGWLYAMGGTGDAVNKIHVFDPTTLTRERVIQLDDYYQFNQLTVNAKGELYVTSAKDVFKISPYGQILQTFYLGGWTPTDIDVDPEGRVIFSTYQAGVKITDETFSTFVSIPAPVSSYVSFAKHIPEPSTFMLLAVAVVLRRR